MKGRKEFRTAVLKLDEEGELNLFRAAAQNKDEEEQPVKILRVILERSRS